MLKFGCFLTLSLLLAALPCQAQQRVPYQQLLLLVAGPSGDRIDPREQAVVDYLNGLRSHYDLNTLQMGTMHYDRPNEAKVLKNPLGFSPQAGITVGLVQLSEQGLPVRTLYKLEGVTAASIEKEHRQLLGQWSQLSEQTLPAALQQAAATVNPQFNSSLPPPKAPPGTQVYTFEGIRTTVVALQDRTDALWRDLRDQTMRDDRMDLPVREASLKLTEAATNLRQAHEAGVIYPLAQLQAVREASLHWAETDPQLYLPTNLRGEVEPIKKLLQVVEAIEYQASHQQVSPSP